MKILHRLMLKQFIGPFFAAFFIVIFALLMQTMWKYIDDLVGKGLSMWIIAEFLLYSALVLFNMAFPLAVLLASIFTLGNMGENYELIALKSAGVSLYRILFPLIVLTVMLSIGAFFFANNTVPWAYLKWRTLVYDINQQRPELRVQEEVFYNGIDGYSVRIGRRDLKTNTLYDLRLYDHTLRAGNISVTLADSGYMRVTEDMSYLELELFSGHMYADEVESRRTMRQNKNYPFSRRYFDRQVIRIELPNYEFERSDEEMFKSGARMMSLPTLTSFIDSFAYMIKEQQEQMRSIILPAYRDYELAEMPVDTTHRTRVSDNFRVGFDQMPKERRQTAVQTAETNVRQQRDQIAGLVFDIESKSRQLRQFKIEWHRMFNIAVACFIFLFIGAPLGAIIRKGGIGTPIIIAVLFFVMYYVISMIGERSFREGAMSSLQGMWMSTFIILTIGVFLTWMATRDSSIFNQEIYANYFKKGLNFIFAAQSTSRPELDYRATAADLDPENMLAKVEELSLLCKSYLDGNFRKRLRISKIWEQNEDSALKEIGQKYDHILSVLKQSDVDMIRETVDEYPQAALRNHQIKKEAKWMPWAAAAIFPAWIYLFLKALIQKNSLHNELNNITGANRNLVNELNSVL